MKVFVNVQIATSVDAAELTALLVGDDVLGSWEHDGVVHLYWDAETWHDRMLLKIREALKTLGQQTDHGAIGVHRVPWQDWNKKWTEHVRPVQIGRRLLVRPSWTMTSLSDNGVELILDPAHAFGTGHHGTTQLLAEWLEDCIRGGERVLDVGTGSGILAMFALRLGAASSLGVDHDQAAIECAHEYGRINHFGSELDLRTLSIDAIPKDSFDLILANIDKRTLLRGCQRLTEVAHHDTRLLMSGILHEDQADIVHRYGDDGWRRVEARERGEWVAIQFRRDHESG